MRILVHICCGPCAIAVLERLVEAGHSPVGFFFNPNIQPLGEYLRRRAAAGQATARLDVPLLYADALAGPDGRWSPPSHSEPSPCSGHEDGQPLQERPSALASLPPSVDPVPWLRMVSGREQARCGLCWNVRLAQTAAMAASHGYDAFTSSLLYSRHQQHASIRALGCAAQRRHGVPFYYEDFRVFWQQGIERSREWGLYRQQYCGCLYSEYERYARDARRAFLE